MNGRIPDRDPAVLYCGRAVIERLPEEHKRHKHANQFAIGTFEFVVRGKKTDDIFILNSEFIALIADKLQLQLKSAEVTNF